MKYTVSIEIDMPRERVVELLADQANLPKWLHGLVQHEPLAGEPGAVGSTSRFVFQMGKQSVEIVETVTRHELPDVHEAEYDTKGMWNVVCDRFIEVEPDKTRWVSENEFRFRGFMMRLIGLLMPGAFRKQTLVNMKNFKAFAEHGTDVRETATAS